MKRRTLGILVCMGMMTVVSAVHADDFGKFLEKAGKDILKKQVSKENLERTLAPHALNADIHTVKTADGWTLVAHRYRANPQGPMAGSMPIILCHGLSYSALFWDLDPSCSLAQYLARQGYDVWSVSLRGCGLSQKWVWKVDAAPTMIAGGLIRNATGGKVAPTGYSSVDPKYADWSLDDHINYDVPAFVFLVKHHTNAKQVAWIGHSMGGIIAIAHLTRYENPGIGKLVTVGSQVTMPEGQLFVNFVVEMIKVREKQLVGKMETFDRRQMMVDTKTSVDNMFFNERNVKPEVYQTLCASANDVPSIGLLKQYMVMGRKGELLDAKQEFNYARNLQNVTVPMLISAGAADQLAPPKVQKYLYDNVGSKDRHLVIFGRGEGYSVDSGHNDSLVGLTSRQEVYPIIDRWLRTGKP